jgi:hypothetical protein
MTATTQEKANGHGARLPFENLNQDSFQSALSGEAAQIRRDGGLAPFMINMMASNDPILPWSEYPHARDRQLAAFARDESIFAGAEYSDETRIKNLNIKLTGSDRLIKLGQTLLDSGDGGKGLSSVVGKMVLSYHTQDNGWFVELVGAGNPDRPMIGRPVTYNFLDPACCYRTFDPEYPVFYRDPLMFKFHRLHVSRVIFGASMPQTSATARGVGFCTLSRALRLLRVIQAITVYKDEKISGRFTRAIGYGKGLTNEQLTTVMQANAANADALGLTVYNGIPFFTTPMGVELNLLDLASVPDGFDTVGDTTLYVYALALAFGVDARELWPAVASGATKADASIQHMKAQGKGIADRIATVEWMLKNGPLRGLDITAEADFTDDEQDERRTNMHATQAQTYKTLYDMGALSGREVKALAVSEGIVDGEALANADEILKDIPDEEPPPTPPPAPPPTVGGEISPPPSNEMMNETLKALDSALRGTKEWKHKDYAATRSDFTDTIYGYIQQAQADETTRRAFAAKMRSALYRSGLTAFRDGMESVGYSPESLSPIELAAYRDWQADQSQFVTDFGKEIFSEGITETEVQSRTQMWAGMSLDNLYHTGMALAAPQKKYRWKLGNTEKHCETCLANDGQVKTLAEWEQAGFPKTRGLACGGFNCDCSLEEAD